MKQCYCRAKKESWGYAWMTLFKSLLASTKQEHLASTQGDSKVKARGTQALRC